VAHILYVEDDLNLGFVTKDNLEANAFVVTHCADGASAWAAFQADSFDLCVLDVMLPMGDGPGWDGYELARRVRQQNPDVPILFLSALADRDSRLTGLRLGADDYLTKPFSIEELVLKINVFLRRRQAAPVQIGTGATSVSVGQYQFDAANLTLTHPTTEPQTLTQREADVLTFLLTRRGQVVRRDELLRAVWGDDDYFMGRSLDVFISRLRKRLAGDPALRIENRHGVGFRLLD
jgi:DNA-binding response OmpR family regulator